VRNKKKDSWFNKKRKGKKEHLGTNGNHKKRR
jgi:hypothetical protein